MLAAFSTPAVAADGVLDFSGSFHWKTCADEGDLCSVSGTQVVRYGAANKYAYGVFSSDVSCSDSVFGDPTPGRKDCSVLVDGPALTGNWVPCASELGSCDFAGTQLVRYGANGFSPAYGTFTDGVGCDNGVFGDPIPGAPKECSVFDVSTRSFVFCAVEGGSCSFSGTQIVRYFARNIAAYGTFTDGVGCDNGVFGDPIFGVQKECSIFDGDLTTTGKIHGEGHVKSGGDKYEFTFDVRERHSGSERGSLSLTVDSGHGMHGHKKHGSKKSGPPVRDRFRSTGVTFVAFSDDPSFRPGWSRGRRVRIDSSLLTGAGEWNGDPGYTFEVQATDQGEPGRRHDSVAIFIRDASGEIVAQVNGDLDGGNVQSTPTSRGGHHHHH